jgi:hypothetical protein
MTSPVTTARYHEAARTVDADDEDIVAMPKAVHISRTKMVTGFIAFVLATLPLIVVYLFDVGHPHYTPGHADKSTLSLHNK